MSWGSGSPEGDLLSSLRADSASVSQRTLIRGRVHSQEGSGPNWLINHADTTVAGLTSYDTGRLQIYWYKDDHGKCHYSQRIQTDGSSEVAHRFTPSGHYENIGHIVHGTTAIATENAIDCFNGPQGKHIRHDHDPNCGHAYKLKHHDGTTLADLHTHTPAHGAVHHDARRTVAGSANPNLGKHHAVHHPDQGHHQTGDHKKHISPGNLTANCDGSMSVVGPHHKTTRNIGCDHAHEHHHHDGTNGYVLMKSHSPLKGHAHHDGRAIVGGVANPHAGKPHAVHHPDLGPHHIAEHKKHIDKGAITHNCDGTISIVGAHHKTSRNSGCDHAHEHHHHDGVNGYLKLHAHAPKHGAAHYDARPGSSTLGAAHVVHHPDKGHHQTSDHLKHISTGNLSHDCAGNVSVTGAHHKTTRNAGCGHAHEHHHNDGTGYFKIKAHSPLFGSAHYDARNGSSTVGTAHVVHHPDQGHHQTSDHKKHISPGSLSHDCSGNVTVSGPHHKTTRNAGCDHAHEDHHHDGTAYRKLKSHGPNVGHVKFHPTTGAVHAVHHPSGYHAHTDHVTHNATIVHDCGGAHTLSAGHKHTHANSQYEHHHDPGTGYKRLRGHHPTQGAKHYGTDGTTIVHHHHPSGHAKHTGEHYLSVGSIADDGTPSGGYHRKGHNAGTGKYEHKYHNGTAEVVLRAHGLVSQVISIFDTGAAFLGTHIHDLYGHTHPSGDKIGNNAGKLEAVHRSGNRAWQHDGAKHEIHGGGIMLSRTEGNGSVSGGRTAYPNGGGTGVHLVGDSGLGHLLLQSTASEVRLEANSGGQRHTLDSTGHTLPAAHRFEDNGGTVQIKSNSATIKLQPSSGSPHALDTTGHNHPNGQRVDSGASDRLIIKNNGGSAGLKSDSHSVQTNIVNVATGTVLSVVGLTASYGGGAQADLSLKHPGAVVWNGAYGNPGVYGLNIAHPFRNGGYGGSVYTNGVLANDAYWGCDFTNQDGTFHIQLSVPGGSAGWTGTMSTRWQVINN